MGSKNTKKNDEDSPELYAAIYCRVSTEEQANKGISLHDQEERCLERAKELGYIVKSEHIFRDEGITGTSIDKRPAMIDLLSTIAGSKYQRLNEGNISVIIASNMDRISRSHYDYLFFKKLLEKHSVDFVSLEQEYITQKGENDDMMSDLLEKIISIFNELIVKITAKKTSHAMERKVLDGWFPGPAPFGYKNTNIGTEERPQRIIQVNEEEARIVKEMFTKYAIGNTSYSDLVVYLKDKGFLNKSGKPFAKSSVNGILNNIFYTGKILFKGEIYEGKHEPIIGNEVFERVSRLSKERDQGAFHQKKYFHYLLKGLLFCSKTGNPYSATRTVKKAKGYTKEYYFPMKTRQLAGQEDMKEVEFLNGGQYVEVEVLEKMVEDELQKIEIQPEYLEKLTGEARAMFENDGKVSRMEEMNLQKQIREVKLQIEKLEEKFIVEESISKETYKKFSAKYSDELKKLEKQAKEKKKVLDVKKTEFDKLLEILHNPYELYKKTETPDGKTRLLKLIFERIYVYDKKIQKVQYTASIKQLLDNQAVLFRSKWLPGADSNRRPIG